MEITYIAHSCFKIKGKDITLVIDPYEPDQTGYKLPKLSADIVLVSHDHFDHNYTAGVEDTKLLINSAGEYEMQGVYVTGVPTYHDDNLGAERGNNTMYLIEIDDFTLLHCGDLGHELKPETIELLSEVDILFIPVGGKYTINPKMASNVISSIEPRVVVPMHYQTKNPNKLTKDLKPLNEFLEELGEEENGSTDKYKIGKRTELPEELEIIVIQPTNG